MARTTSRSSTNRETWWSFRVLGFLSVLLLIQKGGNAFEFKVGGSTATWKVPTDDHNNAIYNQWAEKNRFQIGDTLLFVYDVNEDSVLHVSKGDYDNCNTESPIDKFTDGHTVFKFNQSGPHYFISGVADHCRKNQKLLVVVMADRTTKKHDSSASPPSPSSEDVLPPSPAPSGEESPSPPPEENSTPAPSEESSPPKNGASLIGGGFIGFTMAAAFVGSSLALAI